MPVIDVAVRMDGHALGLAQLVDEAHAARMQVEGVAMPPIDARARRGIAAAVVQAAQFLLEIVGRDRRTRVQLERRGIDARRHRPEPALKLAGHDAVEMHDPDGGLLRRWRRAGRPRRGAAGAGDGIWSAPCQEPGVPRRSHRARLFDDLLKYPVRSRNIRRFGPDRMIPDYRPGRDYRARHAARSAPIWATMDPHNK